MDEKKSVSSTEKQQNNCDCKCSCTPGIQEGEYESANPEDVKQEVEELNCNGAPGKDV